MAPPSPTNASQAPRSRTCVCLHGGPPFMCSLVSCSAGELTRAPQGARTGCAEPNVFFCCFDAAGPARDLLRDPSRRFRYACLLNQIPGDQSFAGYFGVDWFDSNIYGGVGAVVMVQVVLALYVMRAWKEVVTESEAEAKKD